MDSKISNNILDILTNSSETPAFIYDGQCPFCSYFAETTKLKSSIPNLKIIDGRKNPDLLLQLELRGYYFRNGAILIVDGEIKYGDKAIQWICSKMKPSDRLLDMLSVLLSNPNRTRLLYPLLLLARRITLTIKGVSLDIPK